MRYCENCFVGVSDNDVVCRKCGAALRPETAEKKAVVPVPEQETAQEESFKAEEVKAEEIKAEPAAEKAEETAPVISLGQWMLILLLCCIPIVNIVMLIVRAATEKNKTKKNFAIAQLIWVGIGVVFTLIITVSIVSALAVMVSPYIWL